MQTTKSNFTPKIQVFKVVITPAFASRLLCFNTKNRPKAYNHSRNLKKEVSNNKFVFNGQTIQLGYANIPNMKEGDILDEDTPLEFVSGSYDLKTNKPIEQPLLIDGQHRLETCIEAGKSIETFLYCEPYPKEEAFSTIDSGRSRSASDHLAMLGEKNYSLTSAALRVLLNIDNGFLVSSKNVWTKQEIEEALEKHPDIRKSVSFVESIRTPFMLAPASLVVAFHYLFSIKDSALADKFIKTLIDGVDLAPETPILMLRQSLLQNRLNTKKKMTNNHISALFIKSWNYERAGKKLKLLRYMDSGASAEKFPVIK